MIPYRSRTRQSLLSWLTILIVLASVVSWAPAAAEESPVTTLEEPSPTATATTEPTATATATTEPTATSTTVPTATTAPSPTTGADPTATTAPGPTATTVPTVTTATVFGTGGTGLRCRTAAVTGTIIAVLPDGSRHEVRGATVNGWVPIKCSNRDGWASAAYLRLSTGPVLPTPTPSTALSATVINVGTGSLRCRTTAVTGATITLLPGGTRVPVRGATVNGWVPITCASQAGWGSAAYLSLSSSQVPSTPTPPPGGSTGTGKYVTVSGTGGSGLRCRDAAVTGNLITLLPDGTRVETRGATVSGWVPVKCAGQAGWVSAAYVIFDVAAGSGELWLDVNLSTQYMRVYRGSTVIGQTYVSTGRPGFATPTGTFYINRKLPTRTMTGVLGGEYYYVPNVPWVMYFTNVGHAIHGAYWHNSFGSVRSHGCINLPVPTAAWLYSITPVGTRVRIHY